MIHHFSPLSPTLAELGVECEDSAVTLDAAQPGLHRLGFVGSPLFEIERDPSPDEPWNITPRSGRTLDGSAEGLPADLAGWLPSAWHMATSSLLAHLPTGSYFLVRARPPADDSQAVLLGNEWVEGAGDHHRVLLDTKDAYAGIVGNQPGRRPDLSAPLLGLSTLNYTGDPTPRAVLFFSCFAAHATGHPNELLLVIPRTGPLVFDNMEDYSAARSTEDKRLWDEKHAEAFARKLAMPAAG